MSKPARDPRTTPKPFPKPFRYDFRTLDRATILITEPGYGQVIEQEGKGSVCDKLRRAVHAARKAYDAVMREEHYPCAFVEHGDALLDIAVVAVEVHAHISELREAFERGALSSHDGKNGLRSNRNAELGCELRAAIQKFTGGKA